MTWYIDQGPESDVIISSRVRLARNLNGFPFPHRMDNKQAKEAADLIIQAFFREEPEIKRQYVIVDLETMSQEDRLALAEKRLISDDLAENGLNHRAIISLDESVSIMINEEDHIRIQSMQSGLNLHEAFDSALRLAGRLDTILDLSHCERYGYLTACPTNTGTGMRASVMAHLPGLVLGGRIKSTVEGLQKLNFAVRGRYGEHSKSQGNLFQISNQLTLGISEADLINDLQSMLQQLIEQERQARQELYRQQRPIIEDRVMRAYGILTAARLMSTQEAEQLLSDLRLGISLELICSVNHSDINRIEATIGPASIQKTKGRLMSPDERDQERAAVIRSLLDKKTENKSDSQTAD